jgi:hypothetical protein
VTVLHIEVLRSKILPYSFLLGRNSFLNVWLVLRRWHDCPRSDKQTRVYTPHQKSGESFSILTFNEQFIQLIWELSNTRHLQNDRTGWKSTSDGVTEVYSSREGNSCSASQQILYLLKNRKFPYRAHRSSPIHSI